MKKTIYLITFLSIFTACSNKQNTNNTNAKNGVNEYDISRMSFTEGDMLLSDVADDIDIVPLETTDKSIFDYRKIRNIVVDKENIFINTSTKILRFNRNGKYINDIGRFGVGPDDFMYSRGLGINEEQRILYVASYMSIENKIKSYSYDGKHIDTFQAANDGVWLSGYSNHREAREYCFINGLHIFRRSLPLPDPKKENWQIMVKDTSNQLISHIYNPSIIDHKQQFQQNSGTEIEKIGSYWDSFSPVLNHYNENMNFLFEANDTIYGYDLDAHKIFPRYIIKSGNDLPKEEVHKMDKSQRYLNSFIFMKDVLESDNYLHIVVEKGTYSYLLRIDKESGDIQYKLRKGEIKYSQMMNTNYRVAPEAEFINDLSGGLPFYPDHHNNKEWIGFCDPEDLLNRMNSADFNTSAKLSHKKEELISHLKNLNEDDNPIMIIVKLK